MKNESATFCILPWIHLSSKADGRLRQCCRARQFIDSDQGDEANINVESVQKIWNSHYMKQLRLDLAQGKKPASCGLCWEEESQSGGSRRRSENKLWEQRVNFDEVYGQMQEDGTMEPLPVYWDLRLGNACNLKCIMCNPTNSSLWAKDADFVDRYSHLTAPRNPEFLKWGQKEEIWKNLKAELENIRELYFSGGEPLLSREHKEVLQLAIDKGVSEQIHLRYDTNGGLVGNSILKLWKSFKSVHLNLSIDGVGESLEYIRYPLKWKRLEEVFQILDQVDLEQLSINPQFSLSAVNALEYLDFIDWKLKNRFKKIGSIRVTGDEVGESHLVTEPDFLSLQSLPLEKKKQVKEAYLEFIDNLGSKTSFFTNEKSPNRLAYKLQEYIRYMEAEDASDENQQTMKDYLLDLDARRGTDFRKTFPLLGDL